MLVGVAVDPVGDVWSATSAREKAGVLLTSLEGSGVGERGGIAISTPTGTPFAAARRLEAARAGPPGRRRHLGGGAGGGRGRGQPTVSYLVFLVLAVLLAAIAVITDSAILVVGAMVVGPEFSAIAAASVGIVLGRWGLVGRSLRLLVLSFAFAVAAVAVLALGRALAGVMSR